MWTICFSASRTSDEPRARESSLPSCGHRVRQGVPGACFNRRGARRRRDVRLGGGGGRPDRPWPPVRSGPPAPWKMIAASFTPTNDDGSATPLTVSAVPGPKYLAGTLNGIRQAGIRPTNLLSGILERLFMAQNQPDMSWRNSHNKLGLWMA